MRIYKTLSKFFLLIACSCSVQAETNITLTYENFDSFPWHMKDGSGVDMILLNMVDTALPEVSFTYTQAPWKRCLDNMKTGEAEGCFAASYKEERQKYGFYPGTYTGGSIDNSLMLRTSGYSLYALKDAQISVSGNFKLTGISGNIAAPAGYSIVGDLQKAGYYVDSVSHNTTANFKKLLAGRVQSVAALTFNADNILEKSTAFSTKIRVITPSLIEKPYFLMFSKQFMATNKSLAEKIWKTSATIRESQAFKEQAGEYLLKQNISAVSLAGIDNSAYNILTGNIIKEAYRRIGIIARVNYLPGKRALIMSSKGIFDGEVSRIYSVGETHDSLIRVPVPFLSLKGRAFTIKESVKIRTPDDLTNYTSGILRGIIYSRNLTKNYRFHIGNSFNELFGMLLAGRVDLILTEELTGKIHVAEDFTNSNIRLEGGVLAEIPVFHYVHLKNKHLVPLLKAVLEEMLESGETERLKQAYILAQTRSP